MGYVKSEFDSESLQGKEITWKVPEKIRERQQSEKTASQKETNHTTIFPSELDRDSEKENYPIADPPL